MPSLKTTILTSALTLASFLTLAQSAQEPKFPEAIEELCPCVQSIIFPCIADSKCRSDDFPCICKELDHLHIRESVAKTCTKSELEQFEEFTSKSCKPKPPPPENTTTTTITQKSTKTTVIPITIPTKNATTTEIKPSKKTTTTPVPPFTTPEPHTTTEVKPCPTCPPKPKPTPSKNSTSEIPPSTTTVIPPCPNCPKPLHKNATTIPVIPPSGTVITTPCPTCPPGKTTVGPFTNTTLIPVSLITSKIIITTTGTNGQPTTITVETVCPPSPVVTSQVVITTTGPNGQPTTITSPVVIPASPVVPGVPASPVVPGVSATPGVPVVPASPASPVSPVVPALTSKVLITTTGANGQPTTMTSEVVIPGSPTSTSEPFTGAAAAIEAPVAFGSLRASMLAGAIGLMGLVFAEL